MSREILSRKYGKWLDVIAVIANQSPSLGFDALGGIQSN